MTLQFSYTYLDAKDDVTDAPLIRRPEHRGSAQVVWQASEAWTLGVGRRGRLVDAMAVPPHRPRCLTNTVIRFFSHYDFGHGFRAHVRLENAFDEEYAEVQGYPALPSK
ncbi:MAG: hypothetical protein J6386_23095 [Candidatus Synoicihabitans palmerolidicus]|nr:hypothetical protein [Candidatus Synoicihabitans palmerolidicus]